MEKTTWRGALGGLLLVRKLWVDGHLTFEPWLTPSRTLRADEGGGGGLWLCYVSQVREEVPVRASRNGGIEDVIWTSSSDTSFATLPAVGPPRLSPRWYREYRGNIVKPVTRLHREPRLSCHTSSSVSTVAVRSGSSWDPHVWQAFFCFSRWTLWRHGKSQSHGLADVEAREPIFFLLFLRIECYLRAPHTRTHTHTHTHTEAAYRTVSDFWNRFNSDYFFCVLVRISSVLPISFSRVTSLKNLQFLWLVGQRKRAYFLWLSKF
jgi:hypothetical protein